MSTRVFSCSCQKCGFEFEYTGSYENFNDFMESRSFVCGGGHREGRSPRNFVKLVTMSESNRITDWKPAENRNYVDILDRQTVLVGNMQMQHLGSGLYIDRRTMTKYDYEEDVKGKRHYFELAKRR